MKRWWLAIALLLSLGVNAGILATFAVARLTPAREAPPAERAEATPEAPSTGQETTEAGEQESQAAGVQEPAAAGPAEPSAEPPAASAASAEGETPAEKPAAPVKRPAVAEATGERPGQRPSAPPPGAARAEEPEGSAEALEGSAAGPRRSEPPPAGGQTPPEALARRLDRLADHVGLSGETRSRFLALQRRMFVSVVATERRRLRLEGELRRELLAPQADEARIQELIRRQADLLVEMEQTTARTILESRRLLGPDQERRYLEVIFRLCPRLREQALRRW